MRLTAEKATAMLRSSDWKERQAALKSLPEDVDVGLAAQVLGDQFADSRSVWGVARIHKKLPEPVIRALLQRLEGVVSPASIFVRAFLAGTTELADAWEQAMYRLLSLDTTYAWGSKQKRAKLEALAAEPKVVEALQASVVTTETMRMDALAVLAIDASEASVDALMPHFERAAREKDQKLDRLLALKKYASPTPAMTAMLARVDAMVGERNSASPALEFAASIGLGAMEKFWFDLFLASDAVNANGVPQFQGGLHFDSGQLHWFSCHLSEVQPASLKFEGSRFGTKGVQSDALKLGACEPDRVPIWLEGAARKLRCQWNFEYGRPRTNLRGKKRDQMMAWLRGEA